MRRIALCATLATLAALLTATPAAADCPAAQRGPAAVQAAALAHDANALAALFDLQGMADRVSAGLPANDAQLAELRRGLEASRATLSRDMLASVKAAGMHLVEQPAAPAGHVIVRKETDTLTGGVDYLEFHMSAAGCIVDVESLMAGGGTSAGLRQTLAATLGDGNALMRMLGIAGEPLSTDVLTQLAAATRSGDPRKAIALLEAMPAAYRDSYEFMSLRIVLLSRVDVESPAYALALQDMERLHGKDERVRYMMIDRYFMSKRYAETLDAIVALQRRVGVDPKNETLRASVLSEMQRGDEAVAALRRVVEMVPTRSDAYDLLFGFAVYHERHADAVAALRLFRERLNRTLPHDVLAADPRMAGLLASPEYAAWRGKQEG